jgi:hypothetical protein
MNAINLLRGLMTKCRFSRFVCVFLLLFAQQSALAHAAWHAYTHTPWQDEQDHEDQDDASFQGKLCGLDGAFCQVLGGAQASAVHHALPQGSAETIAYRPHACVVPELHIPLSRGPPVLS